MGEITNFRASYRDFKQALDKEMLQTAEGFVRIGYLLNFAADTNIVEEGGYANVNEFAKAEYNIDSTQVSRFVNIYKRFGVLGEPRLHERYSKHGVAKLGIMLTLPDYINEEIGSEYSKSEITAIKHEIEEEEKISDIEVMCEEKNILQSVAESELSKLVLQFAEDYPEEYVKLYDAITIDDVKEIMAPNEFASYKVRIPGTGLILMFAKITENIVASNTRTGEKNTYEWEEFFEEMKGLFVKSNSAKEQWSMIFMKPFPEDIVNAENDNVQQSKPAPKKESKVKVPKSVGKTDKTVSKTIENVTKTDETVSKEAESVSEQLPGQDNIMNHPEYLPEDIQKNEVLTGEVIDAPNDESDMKQDSEVAPVHECPHEKIVANRVIIKKELHIAIDNCNQDAWDAVVERLEEALRLARENKELA